MAPGARETLETVMREVFNKPDLDAVRRFYRPDFIQHNPNVPPGLDGFLGYFKALYASFPDWQGTVTQTVAEGDRICAYITWSGTHSGAPFMGRPADGRKVRLETADTFRVENGQIAEHWDVVDMYGFLIQLGVVPAPSGAPA